MVHWYEEYPYVIVLPCSNVRVPLPLISRTVSRIVYKRCTVWTWSWSGGNNSLGQREDLFLLLTTCSDCRSPWKRRGNKTKGNGTGGMLTASVTLNWKQEQYMMLNVNRLLHYRFLNHSDGSWANNSNNIDNCTTFKHLSFRQSHSIQSTKRALSPTLLSLKQKGTLNLMSSHRKRKKVTFWAWQDSRMSFYNVCVLNSWHVILLCGACKYVFCRMVLSFFFGAKVTKVAVAVQKEEEEEEQTNHSRKAPKAPPTNQPTNQRTKDEEPLLLFAQCLLRGQKEETKPPKRERNRQKKRRRRRWEVEKPDRTINLSHLKKSLEFTDNVVLSSRALNER